MKHQEYFCHLRNIMPVWGKWIEGLSTGSMFVFTTWIGLREFPTLFLQLLYFLHWCASLSFHLLPQPSTLYADVHLIRLLSHLRLSYFDSTLAEFHHGFSLFLFFFVSEMNEWFSFFPPLDIFTKVRLHSFYITYLVIITLYLSWNQVSHDKKEDESFFSSFQIYVFYVVLWIGTLVSYLLSNLYSSYPVQIYPRIFWITLFHLFLGGAAVVEEYFYDNTKCLTLESSRPSILFWIESSCVLFFPFLFHS